MGETINSRRQLKSSKVSSGARGYNEICLVRYFAGSVSDLTGACAIESDETCTVALPHQCYWVVCPPKISFANTEQVAPGFQFGEVGPQPQDDIVIFEGC